MKHTLNFFIGTLSLVGLLAWTSQLSKGANPGACIIFIIILACILLEEFYYYFHSVVFPNER